MRTVGKRGFTFIEVMIYLGLSSIFLVSITNFYINIIDNKLDSDAIQSVQQDGAYMLAKLQNEIRSAKTIQNPTTDGTVSNVTCTADTTAGLGFVYMGQGGATDLRRICLDATTNRMRLGLSSNGGTTWTFDDLNSSESITTALTIARNVTQGGITHPMPSVSITFTVQSTTKSPVGQPDKSKTYTITIGNRY